MKNRDKSRKTAAPSTESGKDLRLRAEEKAARLQRNFDDLSPEETRMALHELQVHQIELEMQNEELRRTQTALDTSRARYFELYNLAPVGYLTISEKGLVLETNLTLATLLGMPRNVLAGRPISSFILKEDQDIYYLHRKRLFETGGPQICEMRMLKQDGTVFWGQMNATFDRGSDGEQVCRVTVNDITDRKRAEADLVESAESLRFALSGTIQAMSMTVEMRDPYTAGHQRRVADLARAIAVEMGMDKEQADFIFLAGNIHDIGKISVPAEILSKPGKLSESEFDIIKMHPQKGYEVLKDIKFPLPIADIILQHHERLDGSGYPNGLKGDEIMPEARIMAVADVVEAMASHRPYRVTLGLEAALEEIEKNKGVLYDPAVVDACLRLFREKDYNLAEANGQIRAIW